MSEEIAVIPRQKWELGWTLRGFNGPMRRARLAKGYSQAGLGAVVGVRQSVISAIEVLRFRPSNALRENIADFLGLDPQDVWPDWLEPREQSLVAVAYQEVDSRTYSMLDSHVRREVLQLEARESDNEIARQMAREKIEMVLRTLPNREADILRMRFGLNDEDKTYTLQECASKWGLTHARVMQIEAKALLKLRNPLRMGELTEVAEELCDGQICLSCNRLYAIARFCHGCQVQGCGECLKRRTVEGKYVYLCHKCRHNLGEF